LPIGRARVFATKWLLGALWMVLLVTWAWASTLRYGQKTEVIPFSEALDVLVAVIVFALTAWSFAAMAGMLGRHRYTVWIALLFTIGAAADVGQLSPDDMPVFRLLGDRTAMARGSASTADLLWALAIALTCVLAAAALALIGSGAMASALARRMTARERVFTLVAALVAGFVYVAIEGKRQKPPFDVVDATYVQGKHARIGVMATADMASEQLLSLSSRIAADVDRVLELVGVPTNKPAIFVMPQQGIDRSVVERASLSGHEGIVLRASPEVPHAKLRAQVVHELVIDYTLRRALREDRHVFLDGLAAYQSSRDDAAARELDWLRFAHLTTPIDERMLTRWEETSERLGTCSADALSFAVIETLWGQLGQPKLNALLRALFTRPPDDARVLFDASPAEQLARVGLSWAELARRVEARRQSERAARASTLASIASPTGRITATRTKDRGVKVEAEVEGAIAYRVLYTALGAWTRLAHPLSRLDVRGAQDATAVTAVVPVSEPRGSRLFAAIELDDPVLLCPVRIHAERLVMP